MPYKDPERQRQYKKEYRLKNREKLKKYNKIYNKIYNKRPDVKKRAQEREQRPEVIAYRKQYGQTERRYFSQLFNKMKKRSKTNKDKWSCKFEFKNAEDLKNHWHKQKDEMGPNCPITRQPLTMTRYKNEGGGVTYTNISPDRLFSSITYTKQNVLFTSAGWNISKSRFKYHELPVYCGNQLAQRVFKILHERFPGGTDEWEKIDGIDWGKHREFYE